MFCDYSMAGVLMIRSDFFNNRIATKWSGVLQSIICTSHRQERVDASTSWAKSTGTISAEYTPGLFSSKISKTKEVAKPHGTISILKKEQIEVMLSCTLNQTCCTREWLFFCTALFQSFWDQCDVSNGKTDRNCWYTQVWSHTIRSPNSGHYSSTSKLTQAWISYQLTYFATSKLELNTLKESLLQAKVSSQTSLLKFQIKTVKSFMTSTSTTLNKQASTLFMYNWKEK